VVSALQTLDHVVVAVADLERAIADYSAMFGRGPDWRGNHPGQGTENALFPLANGYLELLAPSGDGMLGDSLRQRLGERGEGLAALAFGTPDVNRFAAGLRERGFRAGEPQAGSGRERDGGRERHWSTVAIPAAATRGVAVFAIEHRSPPLTAVAPPVADDAIAAFDHVVVMTGDVEDSIRVYGDVLGIRLALDREFPQRGLRLLFFRIGGVTVEVGGRIGAAADHDRPDELWGLAYRVGDVDAGRARLSAAGVRVSDVRPGQKRGTRVCTVGEETHGVATLLIEPEAADG
jgi:catechol 2,3-dioxygenase-like lactoylglutathione lyase family enzyme